MTYWWDNTFQFSIPLLVVSPVPSLLLCFGALLLPMLLASPPGALGGYMPPPCLGSPGSATGGIQGGRHLCHDQSGQVGGLCCCRQGRRWSCGSPWSWMDRVTGPAAAAVTPCGCEHCCSWEAAVTGTVSRDATGFSARSATVARFQGSGHEPPWLSPFFCLLCVFQSTYLQMYTSEEFSGVLMCWEEAPLLSYGCFAGCRVKGRDKGVS